MSDTDIKNLPSSRFFYLFPVMTSETRSCTRDEIIDNKNDTRVKCLCRLFQQNKHYGEGLNLCNFSTGRLFKTLGKCCVSVSWVTGFENNVFASPVLCKMPLLKITFRYVWSSFSLPLWSHAEISWTPQTSETNFDSTKVSEK